MNVTRITLEEALWHWQRGIARALMLMSAFAGMALGTVAYAQITYRNASSAAALAAPSDPVASPGTTGKITFVNAGAVASSRNAITPVLPADIARDDILLLFLETRNQAISIANANGGTWAAVTNSPQGGGGTRLTVFWSRYNGTQGAPTTSDSGDHQLGRMIAVRGVVTTGNPWDVTAGGVEGTTDTSGAIPGTTTTVANTFIVAAIATDEPRANGTANFSSWANAALTNVLERTDDTTNQGNGGGLGIATGEKAAAGTYGNTTVTLASASAKAMMSIALKPALTQLTITRPTGTVAGDVLVASIGFRPFCCDTPAANYAIPPNGPSPLDTGWTLLRRIDNAPAAGILPSNSLAVYWKVAGASEPAAYRWSFSVSGTDPDGGTTTFDAAAGGILKFSGVEVETAAPISDVEENGQCTPAGDCATKMTSHATPSITTPAANTMLVASYGTANPGPNQWTMADTSISWTEAFDTGAGGEAVAMYYAVKPVAGATGPIQADLPVADPEIGNAHILALRSATPGTALTIPIPTGTVAGDVMVASITVRGADRTITPPLGWDEVVPPLGQTNEQTTGTANKQVFYVRAADASDTPSSSYTWTLSGTNTGAVGGILSFSGVDTTAPILNNAIDAYGGNLWDGTATGVIRANEITTNVAGTVAVSGHSFVSSANWSPAAPVDVPSRAVPNGVGISLAMYHYPAQASPGATGNKDATASNDFDTGIGQILALKPAAPPPPAVGGFNAYETSTAAGAITGVIKTKIAGSAISLDIIALNAAKTAIATGFTGTVKVEVLDASNNTGVLDANGCRPTWAVIQTLSPDPAFVAGDNGRKTVTFTQPDSFRDVRMRVSFPTTSPTAIGCSNDNFAIRPNAFANFAVTDTEWETAGTTRALSDVTFGSVTHKAGRPLSVRATALNAAGVPAVTTNYAGAPTATLTACVGAACTATFGTLTLATTFAAGQLASDVASYDNVGSFQLELVDASFASVDAGDSSALEREIRSGTINVGRFVPDHFAVAVTTSPVFGSACGSFTYVGQSFGYTLQPVFTVTAQDFANNTTTLYVGDWWRITNSTLTPASQDARYSASIGTLIYSGLPAVASDPVIVIGSPAAGQATLTFSSGTGLSFTRTTPTAPASPYDADISLAINVIDTDNVVYAGNPARFGQATAGNGIAFNNGKQMRFGRLAVRNANGSQLVPLPVQLEAQYWSGAPTNAFITNTADSCTTIATNNVAMSSFTNNLAACETANTAVSAFSGGRSTLALAAPGSGNNGSVDLTVNLGASASGTTCTTVGGAPVSATTANRPYLQGNWTGVNYDQNPTARATFGVYKGSEEVIFIRENF